MVEKVFCFEELGGNASGDVRRRWILPFWLGLLMSLLRCSCLHDGSGSSSYYREGILAGRFARVETRGEYTCGEV